MDPGTAVGVVSLGIQVCEGLLEYYRDWKGYEDDIRETKSEIANLSKTFALLDDKLQPSPQTALATRAQECLVACQDGIQQLEKKLKKLRKETPTGWRQKAQAGVLHGIYPLRKSTLEKLKEIVQGLIQQLNLALQVVSLDNSHSILNTATQIESGVNHITALTTQIESTTLDTHIQVKATAASIQSLLSAEQARDLATKLGWLCAPDPSINHEQACLKHEPGTGEWLFKSQEYQDWVSGSSPLLWLHGKAGCCKTVLCSTIVEDVRRQISGRHGVVFAYFYFSFSDTQKQSYVSLLLSMITELSRGRVVHPLLQAAYDRSHPHTPPNHVLEELLIAFLEAADISYLVVDALDECSEEQREQIIEGFKRVTHAVPTTRLLMTSRREADIEDLMTPWCDTRLAIDEVGVNADIDVFVKNALATDKKLVRLPAATKREIEDTFHEKSDGM